MQPIIGRLYWCILPSMEAADIAPRLPWLGMLHQNWGGAYLLSRYAEETGADLDPNATAVVTRPAEQLFATQEEAKSAFIFAALRDLHDSLEEMQQRLGMLSTLVKPGSRAIIDQE